MATENLQESIAGMAAKHAELAEAQRRTREELRETARVVKEVGRQLKKLGNKFGNFAEGMALPSMTKLLTERFQMDIVAPRMRALRNGHWMELDVLAFSNTRDEGYVVEVKTHLRLEGLRQMKKTLREFRDFFPTFRDKKVYGILAAVDAPAAVRQKVLEEGIYVARIHDEEFALDVPKDFKPRAF
jgi:hypothetical protein